MPAIWSPSISASSGGSAEKERMFLAEILYGFITRDYMRVSQVHFDAGYVPRDQDPAIFAQALRAIGEPIMDRRASEISMARLLTQLFEVTGQFNMQTQPQLLLLQKTMVVVEGVARTLNPDLNMWVTAEPVVRGWIERKLGPVGKIEEASRHPLGQLAFGLPGMLGRGPAGHRACWPTWRNRGGLQARRAKRPRFGTGPGPPRLDLSATLVVARDRAGRHRRQTGRSDGRWQPPMNCWHNAAMTTLTGKIRSSHHRRRHCRL